MYADSWRILGIAVAVLVSALQIVSLTAPLWIWLYDGKERVGVGLFYRIGFEMDGVSAVPNGFGKVNFNNDSTIEADHWYAIMAAQVLATIVSMCLIPLIGVYHQWSKGTHKHYRLFRAVLWVSVLAWLFNGAGLLVFILYHSDAIISAPDVSHASFSWGALIAGCCFFVQFALTLIIYQCFWGDDQTAIPASADPKMAVYPSTENSNAHQFFQAYYNNNNNKSNHDSDNSNNNRPAKEDVHGGMRYAQGQIQSRRLSVQQQQLQPQFQSLPKPQPTQLPPLGVSRDQAPVDRGSSFYNRPSGQTEKRRLINNDGRRDGQLYRNVEHFEHLDGNGYAGLDNRGFTNPAPVGRSMVGTDVQKLTKLTVLESAPRVSGGDEEIVFNRFRQNGGIAQQRNSLIQELETYTGPPSSIRRNSNFLVTAKHSAEVDVHREKGRYLSHTSTQPEAQGQQQLVLSPSNFAESNVKYNPTFMYRPYSEQVY